MKTKKGDVAFAMAVRVYPTYAILLLPSGETGLLHISELSVHYVRNFTRYVQVGNIYRVKAIEVDEARGFIRLSSKVLKPEERTLSRHEPLRRGEEGFAALREALPGWIERGLR